MGLQRINEITAALAAAGSGAVPAAVIERGTTTNERSVVGTVATIAAQAAAAGLGSPALIVVGAVVALAKRSRAVLPQRHSA